jgi:hypothetical protein
MQTPLGIPQTADAMQLRPDGATRFAGYFHILSAVRLEVDASERAVANFARTISQPFSKGSFAPPRQRFAYRSGADFALSIRPIKFCGLTVSQVLVYHLGKNWP